MQNVQNNLKHSLHKIWCNVSWKYSGKICSPPKHILCTWYCFNTMILDDTMIRPENIIRIYLYWILAKLFVSYHCIIINHSIETISRTRNMLWRGTYFPWIFSAYITSKFYGANVLNYSEHSANKEGILTFSKDLEQTIPNRGNKLCKALTNWPKNKHFFSQLLLSLTIIYLAFMYMTSHTWRHTHELTWRYKM